MQEIFVYKPYNFLPPRRGRLIPNLAVWLRLFDRFLHRKEGVVAGECRNAERLSESIEAGHGILLAPNHSRMADPLVMGFLARDCKCIFYGMASWHLFNRGWFYREAIRSLGGFSVNREGLDRRSVDAAVQFLHSGERPLIIFPEGTTSRTNDRLMSLLEGVSFVARTAAKRRKKDGVGTVVVHPVAIKYVFEGDIKESCEPVLESIEKRLSWRPQNSTPLIERVRKLGETLLTIKEIEHLHAAQTGDLIDRQTRLIEHLVAPLEEDWLGSAQNGGIVARIKALRMKILPEYIEQATDSPRKRQLWDQLSNTYLAQQISCYPDGYVAELPTVDRIRETVERFEEDLTDRASIHGPMRAIIDVGEAIEVDPSARRVNGVDPLTDVLAADLQEMLDALAHESPLHSEK